jgi:predicted MFS family arabinose efflux permease
MHERWLILAALTCARTAMGFQFQSVAAVSPSLIEQLHLSYAALGTLIGLYLLPASHCSPSAWHRHRPQSVVEFQYDTR